MRLYFNGCSFTFGDGLERPELYAWPTLVAKEQEFFNDAVCGGTNDRIVYQTIKHINQFDKFYIAWTSYSRFTMYNPVDNFEVNFNSHLCLDASQHYSDDLKTNFFKYEDFGKMYYTYWYNELFSFKKWLQQILLLQSFFEVKKKKYIMFNMLNSNMSKWLTTSDNFNNSIRHLVCFDKMSDEQLLTEHNEIQELASQINTKSFIKWGECFFKIIDEKEEYKISKNNKHPSIKGHAKIAEIILSNEN